jgi:two-component system sensor histidine kinase VicK
LWFGLHPEEEIELEKATDVIAEADRDRIIAAINTSLSFDSGGDYEVQYTIINSSKSRGRIVRAKGKTLFNEQRRPIRLSGVLQDVTEQVRDEQRKNDFIGMVSHELKTPLTSLTAIIQVLNAKLKESEDNFVSGALDKANIQVKKMSTMINGFLNLSRLESGKIQMDKINFNLEDLIETIISEAKLISTGHDIGLSPCDSTPVFADQEKIGSVISNLLSNAVKYSPKGTHIELTCQTKEGCVEVSVSDEGMGIKNEDQAHLFDRYYRVENPNYSHISGFGIGLYLSSEIVRQHGGRIWVKSEDGKGSTFYFSLPLT